MGEREILLGSVFLFTCLFGVLYFCLKPKYKRKVLVFKALATCMPVLLSFYGLLEQKLSASLLLFLGLFLCMLADIILELHFIFGAVCFAFAHIFLIANFLQITTIQFYTILIFICLYGSIIFGFWSQIKKLSNLLVPGLFYMGLLCGMVSMAITIFVKKQDMAGILTACGGICFVCSDCTLAWKVLNKNLKPFSDAIVLLLYYVAVYLLAASVWISYY